MFIQILHCISFSGLSATIFETDSNKLNDPKVSQMHNLFYDDVGKTFSAATRQNTIGDKVKSEGKPP